VTRYPDDGIDGRRPGGRAANGGGTAGVTPGDEFERELYGRPSGSLSARDLLVAGTALAAAGGLVAGLPLAVGAGSVDPAAVLCGGLLVTTGCGLLAGCAVLGLARLAVALRGRAR